MKSKSLFFVVVLTVFAQGAIFAAPLRDRQIGTETRTVDPAIEYDTLAEQVNVYLNKGDYAVAIPMLERMHELKPRELMPVELLGILYSNIPEERPEFANALFWLLEAEKMHSSNSYIYYNLTCIYSLKNDQENAITTIEKAIVLGYSNIEWISQDDDLVNFRNTSWWEGIDNNYVQIEHLLTAFNEFANIEGKKSIEERIDIYSAIIASLIDLAPHIPALRCNPISSMAYSYYNRGNFALAVQYYVEALGIQERVLGTDHPSYTILLNNLNNLELLYADMDNYVEIRNMLGSLFINMGDYAQAEQFYLEAIRIQERVLGRDHPDYANSLNTLGKLYMRMGDYAQAELYLMEGIAINEKMLGTDHPSYATSLNNLGELYYNMGDYAQAERYHLESLSIRERVLGTSHLDYVESLNNLGGLRYDIGDYILAERYYQEALSITERGVGTNHLDYATLLNNMGILYNRMGKYIQAEQYFRESLDITERVLGTNNPKYATSLNSLGALYYNMDDYAQAKQYFLESLSILEHVLGKEHPIYASLLNNLGLLYRNMGDYAQAEWNYQESLSIRERVLGTDHPDYIASLDNLYTLFLTNQEYALAVPFKQEAYHLKTNQVNTNFSFLSEQQRNAYWNANSFSFELTYSLSWHYPVPESNILNYDNALFSKGLLLRTTNAVRDAIYSSDDDALIAQFEELGRLRRQISALRQSDGNEAYIQSLEQQAEALDKSLTQSSAAFREFQTDLTINWQNVRGSLQPDEAAIEFVSFKIYDQGWTNVTQYAALVLRPGMDAPVWVPLCEESVLAEIFERLNGTTYPQEQARLLYDENGPALYDAIWRPLEEVLRGVTTVYYSPSGLLHKISFNAIPVGNVRLMDVYNLNMVSSTREVIYRANAATQVPDSAVVYGGLQYDADAVSMLREAEVYTRSGSRDFTVVDTSDYMQKTSGELTWNYLQFTDTESREIERLLNGNRVPVTLYNGVRGNKESFIALSGSKTEVIHLATHGFFNQDIEVNYEEQERMRQAGGGQRVYENPLRRSGLILSGANTWRQNPVEGAGNGILLAEEVAGLNLLGAELVVLSACETALGEVDNSEGVFGLQRAFKLAGAQTLIMSLWKVDDEATSMLIGRFYENWLSGMGKQDAFKEAQRSMRSEVRYAPPYYWAAFVLMD